MELHQRGASPNREKKEIMIYYQSKIIFVADFQVLITDKYTSFHNLGWKNL